MCLARSECTGQGWIAARNRSGYGRLLEFLMADRLYIVTIGVEYKGGVISWGIVRTKARSAIVASTCV